MRNDRNILCENCTRHGEKICYCKVYALKDRKKYSSHFYGNKEELRKNWLKNSKKYYSNPINKLKARSRAKTAAAIKKGILIREKCGSCGNDKTEAHHINYLTPYENILWLCKKHHEELHHFN